jgi:hypothetical protein
MLAQLLLSMSLPQQIRQQGEPVRVRGATGLCLLRSQ